MKVEFYKYTMLQSRIQKEALKNIVMATEKWLQMVESEGLFNKD